MKKIIVLLFMLIPVASYAGSPTSADILQSVASQLLRQNAELQVKAAADAALISNLQEQLAAAQAEIKQLKDKYEPKEKNDAK